MARAPAAVVGAENPGTVAFRRDRAAQHGHCDGLVTDVLDLIDLPRLGQCSACSVVTDKCHHQGRDPGPDFHARNATTLTPRIALLGALVLRGRCSPGRTESDLDQRADGGVTGGRSKLAAPPLINGRDGSFFEPDDFFVWISLRSRHSEPPHIVGICVRKDYTESRMDLGRFWRFFAQNRPKNRIIRMTVQAIFAQDVFATTL